MKRFFFVLFILAILLVVSTFSQTQLGVTDSRPTVLEIEYCKGMQLTYQRIGGSTLFGAYKTLPDWKSTPGFLPIQGVSMNSRIEDGVVKVKFSVLQGKFLEIETPVGEYVVIEGSKTIVKDLTKFGLVPFEIGIVRASATVSLLPTIVNMTKALSVTVEPVSSNMPSFKVRLVNISAKAIMAYAFEGSINGKKRSIGMSKNLNGTVLIEPGQYVDRIQPYPVKAIATSNGEMPDALSDYVFAIQAVVFEDGTYEGLPSKAAQFRAYQVGQKIQLQHIVNQLQAKYESVDSFAEAISNYDFSMNESVFKSYLKEFPELSEKEKAEMRELVEDDAVEVQRAFFKVFSAKRSELTANPASLQTWVDAEIKQCLRLIGSFQD